MWSWRKKMNLAAPAAENKRRDGENDDGDRKGENENGEKMAKNGGMAAT